MVEFHRFAERGYSLPFDYYDYIKGRLSDSYSLIGSELRDQVIAPPTYSFFWLLTLSFLLANVRAIFMGNKAFLCKFFKKFKICMRMQTYAFAKVGICRQAA